MIDYRRFYEDIEVGKMFDLGTRHVTRDDIISFAREWDPQPFHINEDDARASVFGRLTGSSLHSMVLLSVATSTHAERLALVAALKIETVLTHPLLPDETIAFRSSVKSKRRSNSRPDVGIVVEVFQVLNPLGTSILDQTVTSMVSCRAPVENQVL
jgi:acyl dehydratase